MNQEDIIRMARVAGVRDDGYRFEFSEYKYLERFAALVAAAEREKVEDLLKEYDMVNSAFANDFRARGETK